MKEEIICPFCKKSFFRLRKDKMFCSRKCKERSKYVRMRDEIIDRRKKRRKEISKKEKEYYDKNINGRKDKSSIRLKSGRLYSLKNKVCEICDSKKDLERHHEDYSKVKVKILCKKCHVELHFNKKRV